MHKRELDHLLEAAVAKALGVKLPVHRRSPRAARKSHVHHARIARAA